MNSSDGVRTGVREWLEADGLGGFASGTSTGIRTRRYHALLLTATTPPRDVKLFVRPFLSGRDYHALHKSNPAFRFDADVKADRVSWQPYAGLPGVTALTNGSYSHQPDWYYNFLYEEERARGLDCEEDLAAPGILSWSLADGKAAFILTTREQAEATLPASVKPVELLNKLRDTGQRRRDRLPSRLHRAADAYIVKRFKRSSAEAPTHAPVQPFNRSTSSATIIAGPASKETSTFSNVSDNVPPDIQSRVHAGLMKILSVNVAQPRAIQLGTREVMTGIYKEPVAGRVRVVRHNLAGDAQADLRVHGGEYKAVYAYPFEHYAHWEGVLGRDGFPAGMFGENLTTSGLLEDTVCIGDVLRIGSAVLQVTQPRTPCSKLGHKFARPQFIKEFLVSGRSGFYLRILEEGDLGAGDDVALVRRDPNRVTVRALLGLAELGEWDRELASRAVQIDALPPNWRQDLLALLEK